MGCGFKKAVNCFAVSVHVEQANMAAAYGTGKNYWILIGIGI
jgi:hypothetical protein